VAVRSGRKSRVDPSLFADGGLSAADLARGPNAASVTGFHVAPVSRADLIDLAQMRIMLECKALSESIKNGDDEWARAQ
jgi:hypothetical protein